jgi:hypothetical protein
MLVTIGVVAAVFAIGELLLSLPASRIPRDQAEELVGEALEDFEAREKKRELDEHLRIFQLTRAMSGMSFSPAAYLLSIGLDSPEYKQIIAERDAALAAAAKGESYEFKSIHARVFFHMLEEQQRRKKK